LKYGPKPKENSSSTQQPITADTETATRDLEVVDILDLVEVQITMTLEQLLQLVSSFWDGIHHMLEGTTTTLAALVRCCVSLHTRYET
jgi:hypothetical protein